jgi:hypothetical protein
MKKLLLLLLFASFTLSAQVPQKMSYQAVLRDATNELLTLRSVGMRISLTGRDLSSSPSYVETHYTTTNINGVVTLQIGQGGVLSGSFSSIDWSQGPFFIKTETDPNGGSDYQIVGSSELLSVPFALYALKSDQVNQDFVKSAQLKGKEEYDINLKGSLDVSKNVTVAGNLEALGATSTLGTNAKPFKGLYLSSGSLSIASDTLGQNVPAAILSNVAGNLQISAGGLKLMGDKTSFFAPNFVGKLTGNATTATKLETSKTINGLAFDGSQNIEIPLLNSNYVTLGQLSGLEAFDIDLKGNISSSKNVTVAGNIEALGSTSTLGTIEKPFKGLFISSGSLSIASNTLGQNVPPAVLSNVAGNLQISAGGVKLMGDNVSFIAPNIVGKLTGNATTATKLVTPRNINGLTFDGTQDIVIPIPDTLSLSRRVNTKLASADTLSLSRRVNTKLAVSDTTALAAKFYRITNPSSYITAAGITGKLNISDTTAMLNKRFARDTVSLSRRINTKLAGADTLSISNRINLKLGRMGNQTLSGNLVAYELQVSDGYTLRTPSVSFSDGSVQTSASHAMSTVYTDGGGSGDPRPLDLSFSVHKLADSYFYLKEGTEGQIIYIVPNGRSASAEDIHIIIERSRKWDRGRLIELEKIDWQPFFPLTEIPTIVSALFTDGAWNVSAGTLR